MSSSSSSSSSSLSLRKFATPDKLFEAIRDLVSNGGELNLSCPGCGVSLPDSITSIIGHTKICASVRVKCNVCNQMYYPEVLKLHSRLHELGDLIYSMTGGTDPTDQDLEKLYQQCTQITTLLGKKKQKRKLVEFEDGDVKDQDVVEIDLEPATPPPFQPPPTAESVLNKKANGKLVVEEPNEILSQKNDPLFQNLHIPNPYSTK